MTITYSGLDNILIRLGIALCSPAMAQAMINEINAKADASGMTAALALKADAATVTADLATKVTGSAGLWSARPIAGLVTGMQYFATDENITYVYNSAGAGTKWYDPTGTVHA